jgi:hypothetical protein
MDLFPAFLSYVVLCVLVAVEAARQGRFAVGILIFSFVLTPIVTLWYLILTGRADPKASRGPAAVKAPTPLRREPLRPGQIRGR